jgi:hypothetical protein
MKVESLTIERTNTYSSEPGILKGSLTLKGSTGEQTIVMSPGLMSAIFKVVAKEACIRTIANAQQTAQAMQDAVDEPLLLEGDGQLLLEGKSA